MQHAACSVQHTNAAYNRQHTTRSVQQCTAHRAAGGKEREKERSKAVRSKVVSVSCGHYHTACVVDDGRLYLSPPPAPPMPPSEPRRAIISPELAPPRRLCER